MARAFIGVGSNIDPDRNVRRALKLLGQHVDLTGISTFYRTKPVMHRSGPDFYNGVVAVETSEPPAVLKFGILRSIERQLGRTRTADKHAPRTIDLDLLLYGNEVFSTKDLTLPHPDILRQASVAVPLSELAPQLNLPGSGISIQAIADDMPRDELKAMPEYTRSLRQELIAASRVVKGAPAEA